MQNKNHVQNHYAQTHSLALIGLDPQPVICEIDLANQLPALNLVGLPSHITNESKERIRAAILNSGLDWPDRKITINLIPATLPKWGSHFELPMAIGVLIAQYELKLGIEIFAAGELSLSGRIRPCGWFSHPAKWINDHLLEIGKNTDKRPVFFLTPQDANALKKTGNEIFTAHEFVLVETIAEVLEKLVEFSKQKESKGVKCSGVNESASISQVWKPNLSILKAVKGEHIAVVNALLAIAGRHHALFAGPQGRGKSMLIKAIVKASLPMSEREKEERLSLRNLLGGMIETSGQDTQLARKSVFLQTSTTRQALEGSLLSNGQVLPGELTRAHHGILVADEFLEFRRDALECLRQPLEEGIVRLQRAKFRSALPSEFQFLSSTNLCPCGVEGKPRLTCRCHQTSKRIYQKKLSGPILDRFDLISFVGTDENYREFPERVQQVMDELLQFKKWEDRLLSIERRLKMHEKKGCQGVRAHDLVESKKDSLWLEMIEKNRPHFSKRVHLKILNVAKTLAVFLDEPISKNHVETAIALRADIEEVLVNGQHSSREKVSPNFGVITDFEKHIEEVEAFLNEPEEIIH